MQRIARSVADYDAIDVLGMVRQIYVPRHAPHSCTAGEQRPDDLILGTYVDEHDGRVATGVMQRRLRRHQLKNVPLHIDRNGTLARLFECQAARKQPPPHGSAFAQSTRQRSRVDARNAGDLLDIEPTTYGSDSITMTKIGNIILHDKPLNLDSRRLIGAIDAIDRSWDWSSVVADQWIR